MARALGRPSLLLATALVAVLLSADEVAAACWDKSGKESLANPISYVITTENCGRELHFIVNILEPVSKVHKCAGVLFNSHTVLTTATCLEDAGQNPLVKIGSYHLNDDKDVQVLGVQEARFHPNFNKRGKGQNDIAILILEKEAIGHDTVGRITSADHRTDTQLSAVGWFRLHPTDEPEQILHGYSPLSLLTGEKCPGASGQLPTTYVCARSVPAEAEGTAASIWDIGSPLLQEHYRLVGLASMKIDNNRSQIAYTNVSEFETWIEEIANADYKPGPQGSASDKVKGHEEL